MTVSTRMEEESIQVQEYLLGEEVEKRGGRVRRTHDLHPRRHTRKLWFQNNEQNGTSNYYGYNKNVKHCYVEKNPLLTLEWNESTSRYAVARASRNRSTILNSSSPAISTQNLDRNHSVVTGRLCQCSLEVAPQGDQYYCPDGLNNCLVEVGQESSIGSGIQVTCYNSTNTSVVKYLFPLSLFLCLIYTVMCFCSPKGLAARMFARKRLCRCLRERNVRYEQALEEELDWMLQHQRARLDLIASQRNQGSGQQQQRLFIPGSTPVSGLLLELSLRQPQNPQSRELQPQQPSANAVPTSDLALQLPTLPPSSPQTAVLLKTCLYNNPVDVGPPQVADRAATAAAAEEREESACDVSGVCTCSICLVDYVPGDRVGDLSCGHIFHVGCLKSWIQRRNNQCPLCKSVMNLTQKQCESSHLPMTSTSS